MTVKERLEDWLSKVFGESFPFEEEPRHEEGEEDSTKEDGRGKEEKGFKGAILRLRGKTGFFELDQVLYYTDPITYREMLTVDSRFLSKTFQTTGRGLEGRLGCPTQNSCQVLD